MDTPTIDAIFIVRFDTRRGNVLEWSESVSGVRLDGVEFSALPSGLHSTSQDTIYFHQEGCIGVAVFMNEPADDIEHRGARMIAVGILVKPSAETGRCGQVWRHLEFLRSQARHHVIQNSDTTDLSTYFTTHQAQPHVAGSSSASKRDAYRASNLRRISRSFTLSEPIQAIHPTSAWLQESQGSEDIPECHPSRHFLRLVQDMGPSIFVIWKAALLKKRILIYTPPPVETACLAVYNICLMATIPFGATISPQNKPSERLQPLFCVGIHDMDHMNAITGGYVACTTDKLFMFKPQLYDVLVDLSASTSKVSYSTSKLPHPKIQETRDVKGDIVLQDADPHLVDNRRYFALLQQLGRFRRQQEWLQRRLCIEAALSEATDVRIESSTQDLNASALHTEGFARDGGLNMSDTLRKMITGGWWWWYGDGDSEAEPEEYESLIPRATQMQGLESELQGQDPSLSSTRLQDLQAQSSGTPDMEAIRFFHSLTRAILSDLGRLISFRTTAAIFEDREPRFENVDGNEPRWIEVTKDDIQELGLDPGRDAQFIRELGRLYFGADIRQRNSTFHAHSLPTLTPA